MDTTAYWIDSASLPRFPKAIADVKVDVVVIGGGITGVTTAHLTSVTDLRRHQMMALFGEEDARAVWDAGAAAVDQIVSIIRAEDIKCDFCWVTLAHQLGLGFKPSTAPSKASIAEIPRLN